MTAHHEKRPQEDLANFAWCLLVAVNIAKNDGLARNKTSEHLFIMRWLENAKKRNIFSKVVAPDILWMQEQGKKYSFQANLFSKAEYIWNSSAGKIEKLS